MKHKALIVEPTRLFQRILIKIMDDYGIECHSYTSSKDALEDSHEEYTFIIVARTLEGISGEIFLTHFNVKHNIGNAKTVLMIADDEDSSSLDRNNTNFNQILSKKNLKNLQDFIINQIDETSSDLNANILLIEDSNSSAVLITALLDDSGNKVTHLTTLEKFDELFEKNDFDMILTDYHLTGNESGEDVISYVRNHESDIKSHTPILVISAKTNLKMRTSLLKKGANDVITKPYDNEELIARAYNLINNGRLYKKTKLQEQKLTKLAHTDQLTGVYNRHSLYDLVPKYISNAKRHNIPLSLLVLDLDHFKKINDTKGHIVGDIVLKSVSSFLQEYVRSEDMVARFGGEEFVIILVDCNLNSALETAERLRESIEEIKPEALIVTSSIGVSELLPQDDDFDNLFERADKAVYEAKDKGRNKVVAL